MNRTIISVLLLFLAVTGLQSVRAQIAPGPYEILPFKDGFIIEAFKDLDAGTTRADWSGWSGTTWISPNAYNDHTGTDFSLQTGTPLYTAAAGTVTETVTSYLRDQTGSSYGLANFVRIAVDARTPNGELIDLIYGHMLSVSVTNGQRVGVGTLVGLSDNTGNSTSEHLHLQSEIRGGSQVCPFYWGHFKYPIMVHPSGTLQVGCVVRITAASTPIRSGRFDTNSQISTAWQNQLYFSSYPKRGYYHVFIPNQVSYRSGWVKAIDVEEVLTGTVIQPLPDAVTYSHSGQLQTNYPIRLTPDEAGPVIGRVLFGGGRFVADQLTNGYHRIPVPTNSALWGWVKPDSRMIVYPQLINPAFNVSTLQSNEFPIKESFSTAGKSMFGRPKFNRSIVTNFSVPSPRGDTNVLFITDQSNHATGMSSSRVESVLVGKPGHRNYYVQSDVYFQYRPSYLANGAWERFGIFLRDDGFAGLDVTFEGAGNCYAFLWDNDDGKLRVGRVVDASVTSMIIATTNTVSGWHTLRIEAQTNQLRFLFDGQLLLQTNDSTFASGPCGIGYSWHAGSPAISPANRGAYFDNFIADSFDPPRFQSAIVQPDGKLHLSLRGTIGLTNAVEQSSSVSGTNWTVLTNVVNSNATVELQDAITNAPQRFYRARRLP